MEVRQLFKHLLRPLTEDERTSLTASLLANGCEMPIVTWKGIIIDGHNRHEICEAHGIEYKVVERDFDDETAVMAWILENALGRRNLDNADRKKYIGELYNFRVQIAEQKNAVVDSKGVNLYKLTGDKLSPSKQVAAEIGQQYGIAGRTVQRYGQGVKMGYEQRGPIGDEFDQSMPEEGYSEQPDEYAQDIPTDDFNQAEPTAEQIAERKATVPVKPKGRSKGLLASNKRTLKAYETMLDKMQGLRLDLVFDGRIIEPDYRTIHVSIAAERAAFPVVKKKYGR